MIYYWAALSPPAFTWMLEFFCMIMMYNEIQPWIDDYQVFVWVLVGLHHSFVILRTWILKVFNKNTISALVCLPRLVHSLSSIENGNFFFCLSSSKRLFGKASIPWKWVPSIPRPNKLPAQRGVYTGCFLTPSLTPVWYHAPTARRFLAWSLCVFDIFSLDLVRVSSAEPQPEITKLGANGTIQHTFSGYITATLISHAEYLLMSNFRKGS